MKHPEKSKFKKEYDRKVNKGMGATKLFHSPSKDVENYHSPKMLRITIEKIEETLKKLERV